MGAERQKKKRQSQSEVFAHHLHTLYFGVTLTRLFPPPCFIARSKTASLLSLQQQIGQRAKACIDNAYFMVAVNMRPLICEYMGVADLCTCSPSISCSLTFVLITHKKNSISMPPFFFSALFAQFFILSRPLCPTV